MTVVRLALHPAAEWPVTEQLDVAFRDAGLDLLKLVAAINVQGLWCGFRWDRIPVDVDLHRGLNGGLSFVLVGGAKGYIE